MSHSQAEAAVGGVFALVKAHVSDGEYQTITQSIPGLQDIVQKHESGLDSASHKVSGGLAGSSSATSTSGGGDGVNTAASSSQTHSTSSGSGGTSTGESTFTAPKQDVAGETTQEHTSQGSGTASSVQPQGESTSGSDGAGMTSSEAHGAEGGAVGAQSGGTAAGGSFAESLLNSVFSSLPHSSKTGGIAGGLASLVLFLESHGITAHQMAQYLPMVSSFVEKELGVDVSHVLGAPSSTGTTSSSAGQSNPMESLMGMFLK